MFIVIGIMLAGVCIGLWGRKLKMRWIKTIITVLIWLLLFLLGIDVGSNRRIIEGLHRLGLEAIVIALYGIAGSVFAAWMLWKWIEKKEEEKA